MTCHIQRGLRNRSAIELYFRHSSNTKMENLSAYVVQLGGLNSTQKFIKFIKEEDIVSAMVQPFSEVQYLTGLAALLED